MTLKLILICKVPFLVRSIVKFYQSNKFGSERQKSLAVFSAQSKFEFSRSVVCQGYNLGATVAELSTVAARALELQTCTTPKYLCSSCKY